MEPLCLLNNAEKYSGEYVALRSFTDREVISHGGNPVDVLGEARKLGVDEPVVFFVPEKDVIQIY
ncbi:MAG: DUF5678 domain-containing protein [Candidatus Brocadiaceae bacterium]|nr:DUF5678 domain-containing protein [Candidatus Brocadiaceae bacterium]